MDSRNIDSTGVSILRGEISKTGYFYPDFSINDKGISWDGNIEVYSNTNQSAKNLFDVIPVQIKSHNVNSFTSKQEIKLVDLINFKIKSCVIFFSVQFRNNTDFKIFYLPLHIFDLNNYIRAYSPGQEVKSFKFKEFPTNAEDIDRVVKEFSNENKTHKVIDGVNSIDDILKIDKNAKFNITFKAPLNASIKEIVRSIKDKDTYVKYFVKETNTSYVVDKIDRGVIVLSHSKKVTISVNGKNYFNEVIEESDGENVRYKCTNNLWFEINNKQVKYTYRFAGNYDERKLIVNFLFDLYQGNPLFINGRQISKGKDAQFPADSTVAKLKNFYDKFDKLLDSLHIYKKPDFTNVKDRNFVELENIYDALFLGKKLPKVYNESRFVCLESFGLFLFLYVQCYEDYCKLLNWEDSEYLVNYTNNDQTMFKQGNVFYLLSSISENNPFLEIDNFNFEKFKGNVLVDNPEEWQIEQITLMGLNALKAYDSTGNDLFYKYAEEIFEYINVYSGGKCFSFINKMQLKRRKEQLSVEDKIKLFDYSKTETNPAILFAIFVLLDQKDVASNYLESNSEKELGIIKKWPIYNLYNKIKN